MAKLAGLFLLLLIVISIVAITASYGPKKLKPSQCPRECKRRCTKAKKRPCFFYCSKCCKKCLCVPPGYSGNKAKCSCYNNWKTKKGGPKCP